MQSLQEFFAITGTRAAVAFLLAFLITAPLVLLTIRVCRRYGWVSKPRPDRWHTSTPAFFGGVPIYVGFLALAVVYVPWSNHLLWRLIACGSLMFGLGLFDDIHRLAPAHKLAAQIAIATLLVLGGAVYPLRASITVNIVISIVWLVGITNAFNLLDNMDGLSGGVALISGAYLVAFYVAGGHRDQAMFVAVTAGAIAGFLLFNFHPARIFMGDAGSLFLGFMLGASSLLEVTHVSGVPALVFAPVTVLAIPIFDTLFVSVSRRLRGQRISQGGTDHSSHRLVRMGLEEKRAVLLLYLLSAASGAVGLLTRHLSSTSAPGLLGVWFFFLLLFGIHLFQEEPSQVPHVPGPFGSTLKRLLSRDTLAFILDPLALLLSYYLAYVVRFQGHLPQTDWTVLVRSLPIVLAAKMLSLWLFGTFRHSWWRGSVKDFYRLGAALLVGEAGAVVILTALYRFVDFSRAVFAIDTVFTLLLLLAIRRSTTVFRDSICTWSNGSSTQRRVFILGTSLRSELALRFLRDQHIECAGFIDTNGGCDVRRYVFGYPVLGCLHDLEPLAKQHAVFEVVLPENEQISMPLPEFQAFCHHRDLLLTKLGLYQDSVSVRPRSTAARA